MSRVLLAALLVALAFTAVAAPAASARPLPDVCDVWPWVPGVCWGGGECPPPPMYCQPP